MNGRSREKLVFMVLASALLLIALSSVALGGTPPSIEWNSTFGGKGDDYGYSVQETSDGGYIVAGCNTSSDNKDYQVYLVKTDARGKELWNSTFGGGGDDSGRSVQETSDGGYIVAGYTSSFGNGSQVYLIKTDARGKELWNSTFGGEGDDSGQSVQETSDSGYIVAGYTNSFGDGDYQVYLVKTDARGKYLWNSTFGGESSSDYGYSVQETSDGGYIVAGYTQYGHSCQVYLVKTDAKGNEPKENTFGEEFSSDYGTSVQETSDGGYIVAGSTEPSSSDSQVYLVKTDARGKYLWNSTFGGESSSDYGTSVQETSDGGYIVAGYNKASYYSDYQVYLVKTDARGKYIWNSTFGGKSGDFGQFVQETPDGGYIVAGYTYSFGNGSQVYLVKLHYIKTEWAKTHGKSGDDSGSSVQQTPDGGYVVAGLNTSFGNCSQAYLLKTDTNGDKIWEKDYGGSGSDDCRSVQQTSGRGYILGGTTESFGNGSQVYLVDTDASGKELWNSTFGGSGDEEGYAVQETSDEGFIATGTTTSFGNGSQVYLVKTNSVGDMIWEKNFGGSGDEGGYSVQRISDGYIVAGYTTSFGKRYQVYLLKTDTEGNRIWEKDFGGMGDDWGYSIQQSYSAQQVPDGYIVAGYTTSFGKHYQVYLLKTDTEGNKIWEKDFGGEGEERGYSVQQTPDGGYIVAGYATPYINGSQVYVVKTDADGNELWHYRFGGAGDEGGMSIANTDDGNYIVAGATNSFGNGDQVYLAKLVNLGSAVKSSLPQGMIGLNNSTKISTSAQPNHLQSKRSLPAARQMKQPKRAKILSK